MPEAPLHPARKEIARYVLARGVELRDVEPAHVDRSRDPIPFPDGLGPAPQPIDPVPDPSDALPKADVVVITWTVDEADALASVFTHGISRLKWYPYARNFDQYAPQIRGGAPALSAHRLGSYMPTRIGPHAVLAMKSELHMNQDGKSIEPGKATLPVKDFFKQIAAETEARYVLTIGTSGAVFENFGLGDVVMSRAAKFRCQMEFRNQPFNGQTYRSEWEIPTAHFDEAEHLMNAAAAELQEPPIGPPTKGYEWRGPILGGRGNRAQIRLDGRDMPEYHPILTTDYFEYGTSANRLDREGAAVEMGDAALGLAATELNNPPRWAAIRNMSDPVINGDLPAKDYHLNEQTTWAVGYYTAYGFYTSVCGAIATWGVIAGLPS
jgi:hypothetical protein